MVSQFIRFFINFLQETLTCLVWQDFCAVVVEEDSTVGPLVDKVRFLALFSIVYTKRWLVFKCDIKFVVFPALVFTFFLQSLHVGSSFSSLFLK